MTSEDGGRDAGADIPAGTGTTGEPDVWGAEPPPVPRPRTPPAEPPAGPALLDDDTWVDIDPGGGGDEAYQGRRRATVPSRPRWLLVALILGGLAAVVLIPLSMTSLLGVNDAAGPPTTVANVGPSEFALPEPPVYTPASETPTPAATATPTPTPAPRTTTRRPRTTTTRPPNPPPPTFGPLSFEAEDATRFGSADIMDYPGASGGQIVVRVGDWGPGPDGSVRFNGVQIPTNGTYTLRIHFVHVNDEPTRTGVVTITGLSPIVTTFQGSNDCCAVKTLTVTLTAGTKTITISNNDGHGPALDRIVISRP